MFHIYTYISYIALIEEEIEKQTYCDCERGCVSGFHFGLSLAPMRFESETEQIGCVREIGGY